MVNPALIVHSNSSQKTLRPRGHSYDVCSEPVREECFLATEHVCSDSRARVRPLVVKRNVSPAASYEPELAPAPRGAGKAYIVLRIRAQQPYHLKLFLLRAKLFIRARAPTSKLLLLRARDVKASRPMWPRGQIIRPQPRPHSFWPRPRSPPHCIWHRPHRNWPRGLEYLQCT